jgi:hypothetical protein
MTDTISAVSSASSTSSSSSSSTKLTAATKAKLEALGIDTTNIATESEGQITLKVAEAKQEATQKAQSSSSNSSEESIKTEAKSLATSMNVSVSDNDTTSDILDKISEKLTSLQQDAGDDKVKLAELGNYQQQYEALTGQYSSMQTSQAQLSNSMSALASYNKVYQNL